MQSTLRGSSARGTNGNFGNVPVSGVPKTSSQPAGGFGGGQPSQPFNWDWSGGGSGSQQGMFSDPMFREFSRMMDQIGGQGGFTRGGLGAGGGGDMFSQMDRMMGDLMNRFGGDFGNAFPGLPLGQGVGYPLLGDQGPYTSQGQQVAPYTGAGGALALPSSMFGGQLGFPKLGTSGIKLDVVEDQNRYLLTADLPGVAKKDVRVDIDPESRILTLDAVTSSSREDDQTRGGVTYHITERSTGNACRTIRLPPNVDINSIGSANIEHGVLTLALPKNVGAVGTQGRTRNVNVQ